jgi:tetratricopeptide (TPR) repeat protein
VVLNFFKNDPQLPITIITEHWEQQTKYMENNKKNKNTAKEVNYIFSLINQNKFKEALEEISSYETQNPNDNNLQFNKPCFLVDIGFGLKDQNIIIQGLNAEEQNLKNQQYSKYKANICYSLANGYLALYELTEKKIGIEAIPQSKNLQKAKLYFREASKFYKEFNFDLKKRVFANYGNCLDALGRGIEAIDAYDHAIAIDNSFSMAIGNKAIALCSFASISRKYRDAIYIQAYQDIKSIINNKDLILAGGLDAKQLFENKLKKIESLFRDQSVLTKKINHSKYKISKLTEFEKFYLDFCSTRNLFLNFHIHHKQCEVAITDPIFIRLITKKGEDDTFCKLAKYVNQTKEDYATARLLLIQSQFKRKDFNNISRRTIFVNTLDYSQFNLYYGLLKSAFKEAYNILDKIAVFINNYYKLGLPEDQIYFTTIWQKDNKIRNEILKSRNISLYALYDIFQDFRSDYFKKIQDIRNASTHRKLVIFDSMLTDWDKKDDKHNIGYDTMLSETIKLMRLTKSAIIYLINFVNTEENGKTINRLVVPMYADTTQFL